MTTKNTGPSVPWRKADVEAYLDGEIAAAESKQARSRSHRVKDKTKTRISTLREVRTSLLGAAATE